MEVITTRQENIFWDGINKIKIIKENGHLRYKSINDEVIIDLYAKPVTRVVNTESQLISLTSEMKGVSSTELMDESSISIAKKLMNNFNIKKAVHLLSVLFIVFVWNGKTLVCLASPATPAMAAVAAASDLDQVRRFINFVISIMRILAASICALIMANTGLKILTEENADGQREAKKSLQKIIWALFLVFVGTGVASYMAGKMLTGV